MTLFSISNSSSPRLLSPHAINLDYSGVAKVTFKTSVLDSEHLFFTVPRKQMQRVIDSLQINDSRGVKPQINFPAPTFSPPSDFSIDSQDAWNDLIQQHQGSLVQIHTNQNQVEGHLIGIKWQTPRDDPHAQVLLLNDSNVSTYPVDSIQSLSFKDPAAVNQLTDYASVKSHHLETREYCNINIHLHGNGPGQVIISYVQLSSHNLPFQISYSAYPDENAPEYGTHSNLLIKWHAVVQNPLHYDLDNVELTLRSHNYVDRFENSMYPESSNPDNDSSSDSSFNEHKSGFYENSNSDQSSLQGDDDSKLDTSESQNGIDDELVDTRSLGASTCSFTANNIKEQTTFCTSQKISVKLHQCVKIPLLEKTYRGGIIHLYTVTPMSKKKSCYLALLVENTSDMHFEPGKGRIWMKNKSIPFVVSGTKIGEGFFCSIDWSTGCRGQTKQSSNLEKVVSRTVQDTKLKAKVILKRIVTYDFHNLEERDLELYVQYDSVNNSRMESELEARLYMTSLNLNEIEENDKGVIVEPCFKQLIPRWRYFKLILKSGQKYRLIVTEHVKKNLEFEISNICSSRMIAKMERNMIIESKMAEQLKSFLQMKRDLKRVKRERTLHRHRLVSLRNYQKQKAREDEIDIDSSVAHGDGIEGKVEEKYLDVISKSMEAICRVEEIVDQLHVREVELRHEMKNKLADIRDWEIANGTTN